MNYDDASPALESILESILFTANRPLTSDEFVKWLRRSDASPADADSTSPHSRFAKLTPEDIDAAVSRLNQRLENSALMIQSVAKGYRMATRPEFESWASLPFEAPIKPSRLSQPALETLAVIAYRQPISRAEIEAVRGVAAGGVLETLVDRGVVRVAGRADVPGRPLLYETTPAFLEHFGLKELDDLPNADELKRVPLPQPPEPGGAEQPELIKEPDENKDAPGDPKAD